MGLGKRLAVRALNRIGYDAFRRPGLFVLRRAVDQFRQDKVLTDYLLEQCVGLVLRQLKVNCVLDVGANVGQYGLMLRRLGYKGHIVSFEPGPETFEKLRATAESDPQWSVYPLALGRTNDSADFHITSMSEFSSFLLPDVNTKLGAFDGAHVSRTEKVVVRRLDAVLDSVSRHVEDQRYFLKMDTQGYDLEVFAGAGEKVNQLVGLQSEIGVVPYYEKMPRLLEAIGVYEASGFEICGLFPVSRQSRTLRVNEFDCIMVRSHRPSGTT